MTKFNISAQLQLAAPKNTKQVKQQIQQQLKGIDVSIDVTGIKNLNSLLSSTQKQTNKSVSSLQRMRKEVGRALQRFTGYAIATRAVSLFTNTLSRATEEAIAFERELIKISQVTGKTIKQLKGLSDTITDLSTSLGVSSTRLLSTARILSQAGFKADDLSTALTTLAKTELAPTFEDIEKTAEGAIAIFNQFETSAEDLEKQLGAINAVAGKFAVESGDLISVVRRTGGVFKSAGGDLNELIALFTSVRSTTRESAESIATGLRTIFTRIQRPSTIAYLEQFGVKLTDLEGKFVGPFEAVKQLSQALAGLEEGDIKFVEIAEELGGFRQIGKVIPLIRQFTTAQEALNVARDSGNSLEEDSQKAQKALQVQFDKTRERYLALVRSITVESESFKVLAGALLGIANGFATIIESAKPLIPILSTIAAFKIGKGVFSLFSGIGGAASAIKGSKGAKFFGFNAGGSVPGAGNKDSVPAVLTPGEFVIKKDAVSKIGLSKLQAINSGQDVRFYNDGGLVEQSFARGTGDIVESLDQANDVVKEFAESFGKFGRKFNSIFSKSIRSIDDLPDEDGFKAREIYEGLATPKGTFIAEGEVGEQVVRHEMSHQVDRKLGNNDFVPFASNQEGTFQNKITEKLKPILAKQLEKSNLELDEIEERLQNQEIFADLLANTIPIARQMLVSTKDAAKGMELLAKLTEKKGSVPGLAGLTPKQIRGFNSGGFVPGVGNTDTVPAMLTPGEFVIRKDSVNKIGVDTLRQMNAQGLNSGGVVLRPKPGKVAGISLESSTNRNYNTKPKGNPRDLTEKEAESIGFPGAESIIFGTKNQNDIPLLFPKEKKGSEPTTLETSMKKAISSESGGSKKIFEDTIKNFSGGELDLINGKIPVSESKAAKESLKQFANDTQVVDTLTGYLFEAVIGAYTNTAPKGGQSNFDFSYGQGIPEGDVEKFKAFFASDPALKEDGFKNIRLAEAKKDPAKLNKGDRTLQKKANNAYVSDKKIRDAFFARIQGEEGEKEEAEIIKEARRLIQKDDSKSSGIFEQGLEKIDNKSSIEEALKNLKKGKNGFTAQRVLQTLQVLQPFNSGGSVISPEDTVPALLTPGEFVINKKAARNIGKTNLEQMNKNGVVGFNKGGVVGGVQKLNNGGFAGKTGSLLAVGAITTLFTSLTEQSSSTEKSLSELEATSFDLVKAINAGVASFGVLSAAFIGAGLKFKGLKTFGTGKDSIGGQLASRLPEKRIGQTQISQDTLRENAQANSAFKISKVILERLEKQLEKLNKKEEEVLKALRESKEGFVRRSKNTALSQEERNKAKEYAEIQESRISETKIRNRKKRKSLETRISSAQGLRDRLSLKAGRAATAGARSIGPGVLGKAINGFRSVGLVLSKAAGPVAAVVGGFSILNSALKAGANVQAKLNAAIGEGNVERAEELALLNNLSGFAQVLPQGFANAEQRVREFLGGKTRSLIEAQAASQALKNKIDKESIQVAERNKITLEKLNSGQLSFAEALEKSSDIFFGLTSSADVSSNIQDQLKALDENRSTGFSRVLRNIFTVGGIFGESGSEKDLRIDEEQRKKREENEKQRIQAFESAFGNIVAVSRIAVKEGKSLGSVLKTITDRFSLTKEQAQRVIEAYKNQQQAQLDNIKALARFSAGFDPVINRLSGLGVEIDSTISRINGTFQPLQDAEKRISAFASGANIDIEDSLGLARQQFTRSGGSGDAFDRAAGNIEAFNLAIGAVPEVFRNFVAGAKDSDPQELAKKLPELIVGGIGKVNISEESKKQLLQVFGSIDPKVVSDAIASGSGEAIVGAVRSQSQEQASQLVKFLQEQNKLNQQLAQVQKIRLDAERDLANSIKDSISLREQSFSLRRESLGRQVTPGQRGSFELDRLRQDIGNQNFGGSSAEIIGLLRQNAARREGLDRATPQGRQQIEELNRQDQALIQFTQKKIELTREEIKQSQQKIENEKQAAKSLLAGSVLDFLKRSEASVAASALSTGQAGILSQLNASSIGVGFDLLTPEEQARAASTVGMPALSPEVQDPQAARLGEYASILNAAADTNQQSAQQMKDFVDQETKNIEARQQLFNQQSEREQQRNQELEELRKGFRSQIEEQQRAVQRNLEKLDRQISALAEGTTFKLDHNHEVVLRDATGRVRSKMGEAVQNELNKQNQLGESITQLGTQGINARKTQTTGTAVLLGAKF